MLTKEQNDRFTRVGPGTPMGELMRRYWMPFATVAQLDEHPTRAVDLLGEHLIAYKDRTGGYGLMQEFCPHRNVNMLWGIPEAEGLRCPYHGWLFDNTGNCLEQPAESPDSTFKDRIKVLTYPVEELGGMLWTWMGPLDKKPMVPRWEALVKDGIRDIGWAILPCNWLQIMENSLDPVHVEWLHQYFANYVLERLDRPHVDPAFWRQRTDVRKHVKIGFDIFEHGIVKRRVLDGDDETHPNWALGHPICFPNMLRQDQIRVPIDDTHTLFWWYNVHEKEEGEGDQAPGDIPLYQVPLPGVGRDGLPIWDVMDNNSGQDNFAWASQGGIILFRRLLRDQMKIVEQGGDPMNTFRDPATNVSVSVPDDGRGRGRRKGEISTGQATKYSPIAQDRARKYGLATPERVETELAGFGQIHPRD